MRSLFRVALLLTTACGGFTQPGPAQSGPALSAANAPATAPGPNAPGPNAPGPNAPDQPARAGTALLADSVSSALPTIRRRRSMMNFVQWR